MRGYIDHCHLVLSNDNQLLFLQPVMKTLSSVPLKDYYVPTETNLILFYKGAFTEKTIAELNLGIKKLLGGETYLNKRVYSIFIELAQNISYYSAEKNLIHGQNESAGVGTITIKEYPTYYTVFAANLVRIVDAFKITSKCNTINSLSREDLRGYKRRLRNQPSSSGSNGNIGLIQVALLANTKINYEIKPVDSEFSFFSIEVYISKNLSEEE